jgi:hypothetical protein
VVDSTTAAEQAGSVTKSVLSFVGDHPYLSLAGVAGAGIAGVTLYGAGAGAVSNLLKGGDNTNPNDQTNAFKVDNSGKQINLNPGTTSSNTPATNTGLYGWFSTNFLTGLFGTQANADDFMTKAKPWLIGGAVVVGSVVVGYTVKSFRKPTKVVLS